MPTQKKYEYPKEFLTKKGTIKKSHLKKAAEFTRNLKKPKQTKKKKISSSHKKSIARGVSRYHKNCKYSMGVVKNISNTKKKLMDELKK